VPNGRRSAAGGSNKQPPHGRAALTLLQPRLLDDYEKEIVIAEKKLVEVAYGWEDMGVLLER
jgi:hypothetical protein